MNKYVICTEQTQKLRNCVIVICLSTVDESSKGVYVWNISKQVPRIIDLKLTLVQFPAL